MEKWMIVYLLPLEVWMDIFCFPWITREKFGQIVDQIGNFKFAEHAQFYLHEWGKRTLGKWQTLRFHKDRLCKFDGFEQIYLDIPQTPLPPNIKFFDNITISHFDVSTLDFLDKIRPLLTNLVLEFRVTPAYLENLRTSLTTLAPLLDTIHSLQCNDFTLPTARQIFAGKFANIKMLAISIEYGQGFHFNIQENVNTIMEWLTQTDNVGPKLCEAGMFGDSGFGEQLLSAVRQQFLAAKTPSTFALMLDQFADFHAENSIGEELHGIGDIFGGLLSFLKVTRHPAGCNTEEVREWIIENAKAKGHGRIKIYNPTIG